MKKYVILNLFFFMSGILSNEQKSDLFSLLQSYEDAVNTSINLKHKINDQSYRITVPISLVSAAIAGCADVLFEKKVLDSDHAEFSSVISVACIGGILGYMISSRIIKSKINDSPSLRNFISAQDNVSYETSDKAEDKARNEIAIYISTNNILPEELAKIIMKLESRFQRYVLQKFIRLPNEK